MTEKERLAVGGVVLPELCAWRTGDRRCLIRPAGKHCQWHQTWMRRVDVGALGDGQEAAFLAWWEQFQPTGLYADNPGPWWADAGLLWSCLTGHTDAPKLTDLLARELYIRRAEVRRYLSGLPMGETPWERVSRLPLPPWHQTDWQTKIDGSSLAIKRCG